MINRIPISFIVFSLCLVVVTACEAKEKPGRIKFEDKHLIIRASTSTPEQIDAFYTGRGFSREAINEIKKTCFVTTMVKNKDYEVLWLIPDDWSFIDADGKHIKRITRLDWNKTWQSIGLKKAHQSTFGWTQLPESRDLRADEHAAGNLTIPWQDRAFKLAAVFRTKHDKSGETRTITLKGLQCKK